MSVDDPDQSAPNDHVLPEHSPEGFRAGFVALAGVPNVGKSTLMNAILGQKVSIATSRPQTTRNRILGIHTVKGLGQILFVDTPGIHKPEKELNAVMVDTALKSIGETDVVLFVVDAQGFTDGRVPAGDRFVAARLVEMGLPVVVAINKIDKVRERARLFPVMEAYGSLAGLDPRAVVPISALNGDGLDVIVKEVLGLLPEGPQLYPADMSTDQAERFVAAEIIREKLTLQTQKEVPYSSAVLVEEFSDDTRRNLLRMRAIIHVERDSQKAIVIGKGGSRLKQIGSQARGDLERFFGRQVYLDLHVVVDKNWASDPRRLKVLGYERYDTER